MGGQSQNYWVGHQNIYRTDTKSQENFNSWDQKSVIFCGRHTISTISLNQIKVSVDEQGNILKNQKESPKKSSL